MAKMTQTTPYSSRPERERMEEARCFREVLREAAHPKTIYDAFGGIGMVSRLLLEMFPRTDIWAAELDSNCWKTYIQTVDLKRASCWCGDTRELLKNIKMSGVNEPQAAVLDFNRCTLLDLRNPKSFQSVLLAEVAEFRLLWIELTDSSVGKLHLNWRSYGLSNYISRDRAWAGYNVALDAHLRRVVGYRIVAQARHSAASYYRLEAVI